MCLVSPCTTHNLKRSVKWFSVWIVSEVDDSKEARLLRVLPSDKQGEICNQQ